MIAGVFMKGFLLRIREKIRRLNPGQRKIVLGLAFFLILNALILVVSIIVFSRLIEKF